jgi:hypothetical protein
MRFHSPFGKKSQRFSSVGAFFRYKDLDFQPLPSRSLLR